MTHFHPLPFRPHIAVLVLSLMVVLPLATAASAQAAPPPPPTVTLAVDGTPEAEIDGLGGCIVALRATWQEDEVHGAFVDTRLYEVIDGADVLVGAGFRIPDEGSTLIRLRHVPAPSHAYRFELVRGGQERVLASDSLLADVSCS